MSYSNNQGKNEKRKIVNRGKENKIFSMFVMRRNLVFVGTEIQNIWEGSASADNWLRRSFRPTLPPFLLLKTYNNCDI